MTKQCKFVLSLTLLGTACVFSLGSESPMRPKSKSQKRTPTVENQIDGCFTLPKGTWQFPELEWTFSQSVVQHSNSTPSSKRSIPIDSLDAVQMDRDILLIVKALMHPDDGDGGLTTYSVVENTLRGHAIVTSFGGEEIPLEVTVAWPAYDKLWTEFRAVRRMAERKVKPMLSLPDGFSIVATRNRTDGSAYSHLVTTSDTGDAARAFEVAGWEIQHPPKGSNVTGIFWIQSDTLTFEVCVQPKATSNTQSLLIRRFEEQTGAEQ